MIYEMGMGFWIVQIVTCSRALFGLFLLFAPDVWLRTMAFPLVFSLAALSDMIDGQLARAWGVSSTIGKLCDPCADAIFVLATSCVCWRLGMIDSSLVYFVCVRYLYLIGVHTHLFLRGFNDLPALVLGKITMALLMLYLWLLTFSIAQSRVLSGLYWMELGVWLSLFASLIAYTWRYVQLLTHEGCRRSIR